VSAPRDELLACGGFDESFVGWGCEDTELGYRMSVHGRRYVYRSEAENFHFDHPLPRRQREEWVRNCARFYAKHPKRDVELVAFHVAQRITFGGYLAEVERERLGLPAALHVGPAAWERLRADCILTDAVRNGDDAILRLAPHAAVRQGQPGRLLLHGIERPILLEGYIKDAVLQLDGRRSLCEIVEGVARDEPSPDAESTLRAFVAMLVFFGIVEDADSDLVTPLDLHCSPTIGG
jgi:hypothetical protein